MSGPSKRDIDRLRSAARKARAHAHAPYSKYCVGAAVLTRRGKIFAGCNVENASYGATLCAERNAVAAMIAAGDRDPVACVVVTSGPHPASPCGICRQVLSEFATDRGDMTIVMSAEDEAGHAGESVTTTLSALLPMAFRPSTLRAARAAAAAAAAKNAKNAKNLRRPSRGP